MTVEGTTNVLFTMGSTGLVAVMVIASAAMVTGGAGKGAVAMGGTGMGTSRVGGGGAPFILASNIVGTGKSCCS